MSPEQLTSELHSNKELFRNLFASVPREQRLWRPAPNKWNIHEILCHMHDEECDDFRFRTRFVLENPGETPPPFDPVAWVEERDYASKDYDEMLVKFVQEREDSVTWLRSLDNPKWDNHFTHPKAGPFSALRVLRNWLAHDQLHIRQVLDRKFHYLKQFDENGLDYAGSW